MLSLPDHDERAAPGRRPGHDLISANLGRTLANFRRAVLDARRVLDWLERRGYRELSLLGISIGSCVATMTAAHDPRIARVGYTFATLDVAGPVWTGGLTRHVRAALEPHLSFEELRARRRMVLRDLVCLVAGPADVAEVGRYMHPGVTVHMDSLVFRGLAGWQKWIRYSHAASGLAEVELEILELEDLGGERLRATIGGRGRRAGRPVVAAPISVTYRFADDKVAETWTSRHNYVFFFGDRIRHSLGFALLLARILVWNWTRDTFRRKW